MSALYNEIEPYPAAWIRNLIAAGHVAPGGVEQVPGGRVATPAGAADRVVEDGRTGDGSGH